MLRGFRRNLQSPVPVDVLVGATYCSTLAYAVYKASNISLFASRFEETHKLSGTIYNAEFYIWQ
jgi:hypothetical protein